MMKHEACSGGYLDVVKLLLSHNADINALGYQKNTPLHEATLNKHVECVRFMLTSGASANIRNEFGISPRDLAKDTKALSKIYEELAKSDTSAAASSDCGGGGDTAALRNSNLEYGTTQAASQSQSDMLNISCTSTATNRKPGGARRQAPKKIVLFGTGMNETDKMALVEYATKLKIQTAKEMNKHGNGQVRAKS